MICSKCRFDDSSSDALSEENTRRFNRYLCVEGHLICILCIKRGKDRTRKCPICGGKIVKKLNVFDSEVPRLEITQVNSCSSLNRLGTSGQRNERDVIQLEPCRKNFEQLQSISGIDPPRHNSGSTQNSMKRQNESVLIDLSSDESFGEIPCHGLTYFKRDCCGTESKVSEVNKKTTNHVSFNQFPFSVSYDSDEIHIDPRERHRCNLYDEPPPGHEHFLALHSYDEPIFVIDPEQNISNEHELVGITQEPTLNNTPEECCLQHFRIISESDDEIIEQRAGEVTQEFVSIPPIFTIVSIEHNVETSKPSTANKKPEDKADESLVKLKTTQLSSSSSIKSVTSLSISRAPILCPISTCNKLEFKSYVIKHIQNDHPRVLIEMISSCTEKTHLWDTRVDKRDTRKCHILYLLKDRIRDLGGTEFRNYLPVMVMTTKFKASSSLFNECFKATPSDTKEKSHFMIWLTGFAIKEVPVYYTLTLYSERYESPGQRIVFCNELYSWRNDQSPKALYETGSALILTRQQFTQLSRGGTEMIRVKILIH